MRGAILDETPTGNPSRGPIKGGEALRSRLRDRSLRGDEILTLVRTETEGLRAPAAARLLFAHPSMSPSLARELLSALPWGALMEASRDPRVSEGVVRCLETELCERLERLGRGERIALARRAPRAVLRVLLAADDDVAVRAAARGNPYYRASEDRGAMRLKEVGADVS